MDKLVYTTKTSFLDRYLRLFFILIIGFLLGLPLSLFRFGNSDFDNLLPIFWFLVLSITGCSFLMSEVVTDWDITKKSIIIRKSFFPWNNKMDSLEISRIENYHIIKSAFELGTITFSTRDGFSFPRKPSKIINPENFIFHLDSILKKSKPEN